MKSTLQPCGSFLKIIQYIRNWPSVSGGEMNIGKVNRETDDQKSLLS